MTYSINWPITVRSAVLFRSGYYIFPHWTVFTTRTKQNIQAMYRMYRVRIHLKMLPSIATYCCPSRLNRNSISEALDHSCNIISSITETG